MKTHQHLRSLRRAAALILAGSIAALLASHSVQAANLTWDISLGNGATITGGTGTWTNGLGNWNTGAGDTTWNNATPDAATFGGTAGTVTLGGAVTVGNLTININGYIIAGGGNTLTLSNSTVTNNAATASISANLGGTTGLILTGAGVLTLSGTNNYTGSTTLTSSTLSVGASNNLGDAASNLVFNGGTLQITGTALTAFSTIGHAVSFNSNKAVGLDINNAANTFTVDQSLNQGNGGFTKSGAGAAILSQANTYTGTTTVSAGSLSISGSGTLGATTAALTMSGGSLNLGGTSQTVGAVSITTPAASGDTIANGSLTGTSYAASNNNSGLTAIVSANLLANGAAGLSKTGFSTLILSGTNTYTGATNIAANGGMVKFTKTAALYNGTDTSWTKTNITANSGTTLAFNVGGAGEFTTGNVTTLLGNLTTSINNNGLRAGSVIGFDTTNASGGIFTVADVIANSTGTGSGTLGLTKLGTNTLVLTNTNTYTGATTITAGTLQVNGSLAAGSAVAVGTAGTLSGAGTVNGNATITGSGVINFTNPSVVIAGTLGVTGGNWNGVGSVTGKVTHSSGTLTLGTGATLTATGGFDLTAGTTVNGTGNLIVNAASAWSGGTIRTTGVTTLNTNVTKTSGSNLIIRDGTLNNNATLNWNFQNLLIHGATGTFNNTATGIFNVNQGGLTNFQGNNTLTSSFNNAGTFNVNPGNVLLVDNQLAFNNTGTVNVNASPWMELVGGGTNSGTFNIASGSFLHINGGSYAMNAGTALLGAGRVELVAGSLTFNGTSTGNTANLALVGSTMTFSAGANFVTTGDLTMTAGTIGGTGTLTATNYNLSAGTVNANLGVGTLNGSGNVTLNGTAASNTVNVTAGSLMLGASNRLSDTATVTLTGGTLAIGANSDTVGAVVLSSGSITGNTGVLTSASTFDIRSGSATAKLGGSVGLTKTTTASVTLSGGSTYTGPTTVSDGTLAAGVTSVANVSGAFGNNSALSIADLATAGVNITGFNTQIGSLTGGGTTGGNVTLGAATLTTGGDNTSPATYGGIISGTGGLTKIGTGTQTLNGANTFSGTATVSAGVLRLDGATSLTGGTDTAVGAGESRLTLNGGVLGLGAGDFTRALGTGAGQVQITAGGGGFAAYGAPRNVNLGGASAAVTWNTGSFVPTGSNLILSAADATDTVTFQNPINLGAAVRTVQVNDGASSVDAVLFGALSNGGLTKTGAGTLQLTTGSNYAGATTVSAGTLAAGVASVANVSGAFGNNSAVSMANVAGATLEITGFNTQIGSLTGGGATGGNVILGAATLTVGGNNTSPAAYAGVLSGSGGGLSKIGAGTLTLSGANLHSGDTTVKAGTLKLDISGSISNSANIVVGDAGSSGARLDVTTKTGGLTIGATQTLSGIGQIDGNTLVLGTHAPGNSPGLQTFNGNLIYGTGSMVNFEVATNSVGTRGTDFDGIDVIGAGILSIASGVTSNLVFNAIGSTVDWNNTFWDSSHSWPVFSNVNAPSLASGAIFDTIIPSLDSLGATLSGGSFSWQQTGNNVSLNYIVAVPEPATYGALMALGLVGVGTLSVLRRRRRAGA